MNTALITGISSDIGMAIGDALQKSGWEVMGLTHEDMDLSKLENVSFAADRLRDGILKIDALIHVAGLWHYDAAAKKDDDLPGGTVHVNRDLEDYSAQEIADTMNVGVTSFMVLTAKLLPNIARDGCIIGISGTFDKGASGRLPYYTSKRALEDFIQGLAQDYPHGPYAYGISPADTATTAYAKYFPENLDKAQLPEAIGKLVAMLVTPSENYKSGGIIAVRDGHASPGYHA